MTATSERLIAELVAIVEVEGPILGERLHQAHVRAAGGQRVGRQIAHAINAAINTAVRRGLLVQDNPLADSGIKPVTLRLPDQPLSLVRELGPRTLDQVPPRELATVLQVSAARLGWADEEAVHRATLDFYGIRRLTSNATAQLRRVRPLADSDDPV